MLQTCLRAYVLYC